MSSKEAAAVFLAMNPDARCTVCNHRLDQHMAAIYKAVRPILNRRWACIRSDCYCLELGNAANPYPSSWEIAND